jgi:hypothetical protein
VRFSNLSTYRQSEYFTRVPALSWSEGACLPNARGQCQALSSRTEFIGRRAQEERETRRAWAVPVCWCRLRVRELWCGCSRLVAQTSHAKIVLLWSCYFEVSAGKIVLLASDVPTSDNRPASPTPTSHHPIERAVPCDHVPTFTTRRQYLSRYRTATRQHQNPFPLSCTTSSPANTERLLRAVMSPPASTHPFTIPEGRLRQHQNPSWGTDGRHCSEDKGATAL